MQESFTEEQIKMINLFFPKHAARNYEASYKNTKFVHYTNANAALNIFRQREFWMRNSSTMNDFMEIEHGLKCLEYACRTHKDEFSVIINGLFDNISNQLEREFNNWLPHFRLDTFIASISEHDMTEDKTGRLSMWRAYGGNSGVAIIMNNGPLLRPSNALGAYTYPVNYLSAEEFNNEFISLMNKIKQNIEFLKLRGRDEIFNYLFDFFRNSILCTKHPGFHEEKEWRVIYNPSYEKSARIISDIQSIDGAPQHIYKIPMKNFPEEGFYGAEIHELIDRVIIGPTQYPWAIRDVFVEILKESGMQDAHERVCVSDIPLRR